MRERKRWQKVNIVACLIIIFCSVTITKAMWIKEIESTEAQGVIATVKEVRQAGRRATIVVTLKRQDGLAFAENISVNGIRLRSNKQHITQVSTAQNLSEDKKTLNCHIVCEGIDVNKVADVNIKLNELVTLTEGEVQVEKSIAKLYEAYPLISDEKDENKINREINQGEALIDEMAGFKLLGVGFDDAYRAGYKNEEGIDCLYIKSQLVNKSESEQKGKVQEEGNLHRLYDEVTGQEIPLFYSKSVPISSEDKKEIGEISETYFELTNTDKLAHIYPIVSYTKKEVINDGSWDLTIKLDPK